MIMSNTVILPSGKAGVKAKYINQYLDEYNENPLIQALPKFKSKEEIIKELSFFPKLDKSDKELAENIRIHLLQRIYKIFQPLPKHVEIFNLIDTLIKQGYVARNPNSSNYIKHINCLGNNLINKNFEINLETDFRSTATCGLIIGFSGMGKTTTVNRVLNQIPSIIVHSKHNNEDFNCIQVPWIKLEAPHNGSLKALTLQFFMKIDDLLGTKNMERYVSRNTSVDAMVPLMGQLANNIGLGVLIIDEIQHLNKKGYDNLMNYFVALINSFGVPLLLIGTPAAYDMLQNEMRIARRVSGGGEIIWNNMINDKEFKIFMRGLWRYQYTRGSASLDDTIINKFYDKTQGILDLAVKLFVNVQKEAIEKGIEKITLDLIDKVWEEKFKLLKPIIKTLKNKNSLSLEYDDIRVLPEANIEKKEYKNKRINEIERVVASIKSNKIKISELDKLDLRRVVFEGNESKIDVYDSLKRHGFIKDIKEIVGEFND